MAGDDGRTSVPDYLLWIFGGAAAILLGVFLPWAHVVLVSLSGIEADRGLVVLGCGIAIGTLGYQHRKGWPFEPSRFPDGRIVSFILGFAMAAVGMIVWFMSDIPNDAGTGLFAALAPRLGMGVYVSLAGSVGAMIGALKMRSAIGLPPVSFGASKAKEDRPLSPRVRRLLMVWAGVNIALIITIAAIPVETVERCETRESITNDTSYRSCEDVQEPLIPKEPFIGGLVVLNLAALGMWAASRSRRQRR